MAKESNSLDTKLIHAGELEELVHGAATLPIFQSSVYRIEGEEGYGELSYPRYGNLPNQRAVGDKLAQLENAEAGIVTSSGMAAISSALMAVLGQGDHLLASQSLYGGTHALITQDFPRYGIEHDFVRLDSPDSWEARLRPETRAFYVETLTNPLTEMGDLEAVVEFAQRHDLVTLIDNTFASPVNFRPAEHGIDLSLHSCTKYLNGHSDLVAGAVIGRRELVAKAHGIVSHFGGSLDPHACFLLHRGIKTLGVRVRQQNDNALRLATWLESHPRVVAVRYPGLASHPNHGRAARLLDGFGGMLAFEVEGGWPAALRFLEGVELALHAPSLGGMETLVVSPGLSSHKALSAEEKEAVGIREGTIRVSTGIEGIDDLIADFEQALDG